MVQKAEEQHLADVEVPAHKTWRQRRTTSLEMKKINDWLNPARARNSWVMTSVWLHDKSRFKPGTSYECGKAWFVNVVTDR